MNREQLPNELPEPVRRYFVEVARMEPPNDLMDTTLAQVESEPRVNRFSLVPAFAAVAGAAAVVAAIVIGANLFGNGGVGTPASPTATRSPSPSPVANSEQPWDLIEVARDVEYPREGTLPAGDYYVDRPAYPSRIDFSLPDGWWFYQGATDVNAVLVDSLDSGATEGSAWGISFTVVGAVRQDPCDSFRKMDASVANSAASLVAAFKTWSDYTVVAQNVSIGGFSGKRVVVSSNRPMSCSGILFTSPAGYQWDAIDMSGAEGNDQPQQMTFLDVGGAVLAIWTTDYAARNDFEIGGGASPDPKAHVQDQVELHAILDSIVLTPH